MSKTERKIIVLSPDEKCRIYDGLGLTIEGKPLQRCIGMFYWYAHGVTLFDIRELRKSLGFKKTEYADDLKRDCCAQERIMLAVEDAAKRLGVSFTEAVEKIAVHEFEWNVATPTTQAQRPGAKEVSIDSETV